MSPPSFWLTMITREIMNQRHGYTKFILVLTLLFCTTAARCADMGRFISPFPAGTEKMYSVWGENANSIYAVGDNGNLLHWDGSSWQAEKLPIEYDFLSFTCRSVWGVSGTVYAAGNESSDPLSFKGKIFKKTNGGPWEEDKVFDNTVFTKIWGLSSDNIYATAKYGMFFHYDGSMWKLIYTGVENHINGIWGNSADNIYLVGNKGLVLHYNGESVTRIDSNTTLQLFAVWGAGSSVYSAGEDGIILRYDGSTWTNIAQATKSIFAVYGISEENFFMVGDNGYFAEYSGGNISTIDTGMYTNASINSIWGTGADSLVFVGDNGKFLRYDGAAVTTDNTGQVYDLNAVWGKDQSDIFAVGNRGQIVRFNGETNSILSERNTQEPSPTEPDLNSVWVSKDGKAFAVGNLGSILVFENETWTTAQTSPPTAETGELLDLFSVWGDDSGMVFIVGEDGSYGISTDSGANWTWDKIGTSDLLSVRGKYAAGKNGALFQYTASGWQAINSNTSVNILSIMLDNREESVDRPYVFVSKDMIFDKGNGVELTTDQSITYVSSMPVRENELNKNNADRIIAVGDNGLVIYQDGNRWISIPVVTGEKLNSAWASKSGRFYIVGDNGVIMSQESPKTIFTHSFSGSTFTFDASETVDLRNKPDEVLIRWDWENDDIWDTELLTLAENQTIEHEFVGDEPFTVKMEAINSFGATYSIVREVSTSNATNETEENVPSSSLYGLSICAVILVVSYKRREHDIKVWPRT